MDTLFDKISMLISSKLYGKPGRSFTPGSNSSSQRRLRQTIYDLLRVEAQLGEMVQRIDKGRQLTTAQEQQLAELDRTVDSFLLAGDEASAAAAQRQLNELRLQAQKAKMHVRHLHAEHERLQSLRDALEMKMTILGLKREVLDDYIRRYQQGRTAAKTTTWRVLDPEE